MGHRARAQGTEVPEARARDLQDHGGEHGDDAEQSASATSSQRFVSELERRESIEDGTHSLYDAKPVRWTKNIPTASTGFGL